MTKTIALSRPAISAIAAFLVLSTPAAFAQETVPMTAPVAPTTAPAPAPTTTTPPTAETPAPQPVIRVPVDIAPEAAPKAAEPKAAAPAPPKRTAAKPRAATPDRAAPRETAASPAPVAAPAVAATAPTVAPPVPAPIEPMAEAAPAPVPAPQTAASDDLLPWQIAGGAAALLLIGGVGLAVVRRRRASNEVWEFDEEPADAEWIPGAAATAAEPEPEPVIASQPTPGFAAPPSGSIGRHEAMAMAGPTPDNPFTTLHKRLARARFLDRQERAEYEATLSAQKDMRRKPVSAWEISQREAPTVPAEQEVRRIEPGRARQELKPGWTRN